MVITFIRHLFVTLTYARDSPINLRKDFNRYIQSFRRRTGIHIAYFRCVELQRDGTPHYHILIQYPSASVRVLNDRYFIGKYYRLLKSLWKFGLTDYQPPRAKGVSKLTYIMKYLSKNTSTRTIWKKILSVNSVETQHRKDTSGKVYTGSVAPVHLMLLNSRIKLLTWSRNFDFSPFYTIITK